MKIFFLCLIIFSLSSLVITPKIFQVKASVGTVEIPGCSVDPSSGPPDSKFIAKITLQGTVDISYTYTIKALGQIVKTVENVPYQRPGFFQTDVNNLPEGSYQVKFEVENLTDSEAPLITCATNMVTVSKDIGQKDCQISLTPNPPEYDKEIKVGAKNLEKNKNSYRVRVMGPNNYDSGPVDKGATDGNGNFDFSIGPYGWEGKYTLDIYEGNAPICKQIGFSFVQQDPRCKDIEAILSNVDSCVSSESNNIKPKIPCFDIKGDEGFKCPRPEQAFCTKKAPPPSMKADINDIYCEVAPPAPPPCSQWVDKNNIPFEMTTEERDKLQNDKNYRNEKQPRCATINTGLGIGIDTQASAFAAKMLGIILSISGGIAVLLIIISGYRFMASQGNPEKVQAAREGLTSAIVGLLFIIFSIVILKIIGIDILHLPGFEP